MLIESTLMFCMCVINYINKKIYPVHTQTCGRVNPTNHSTILVNIIELKCYPMCTDPLDPVVFHIYLLHNPLPIFLLVHQQERTGGHSEIAFTSGRAVDAHPWNKHVHYNLTSHHHQKIDYNPDHWSTTYANSLRKWQ